MQEEIQPRNSSDKIFWHGYIDFYEPFFRSHRNIRRICEMGIFEGDSIRWLMERFQNACITGVDIVGPHPRWPKSPRVTYEQLDQGDRTAVRQFFARNNFDLIIEDGSHNPSHQAACLAEGMQALRTGGIYILEDIHTSMPSHTMYKAERRSVNGRFASAPLGTALSTLLAIDHIRRIGNKMTPEAANRLALGGLMSGDEIMTLDESIDTIMLYKRTHLPDHCYACGKSDYNYHDFRCHCGTEIFAPADSMSFVLGRR